MAGADAARTDFHAFHAPVANGLNLLQVWIPDFLGFVIGMAHIIAEARSFTADFAYFRHFLLPPV